MKRHALTAILALFILTAGSALAASPVISSGSVYFPVSGPGVLSVSGPAGYHHSQELGSAGTTYDLYTAKGNVLADGSYTWQITLDGQAPAERSGAAVKGESFSGSFTIAGGSVADPNAVEGGFNKDQVFLDDLIVDGSACIGLDCANGESFGFDTLRLKENNLRIKFVDTSTTATFPGNDWQITANESDNGGLNKFSIDDIDGGKTPFTIEAGAPSHALYVDSSGKIGVGTSAPVGGIELHIKDGDSPTVRLEQDGSSGFTPQTWDIAGNEANFFIRDVTNGSKLPFKIKPGAPTSSIFVAADGSIGLGTESPTIFSGGKTTLTLAESSDNVNVTRLGLDTGGTEDFAVVAAGDQGQLIFASSTTQAGILVLDAAGLSTGVNAGSDLCVGAGNVVCACGACP